VPYYIPYILVGMTASTKTYRDLQNELSEIHHLLTNARPDTPAGITTSVRTYGDISGEVKGFAHTHSWLSFYVAEAIHLKKDETPVSSVEWHNTRQKLRLEHMAQFAHEAVTAQGHHLSGCEMRTAAVQIGALVGALPVPPLKIGTRMFMLGAFNNEIIKRMGMADREDVNRLHHEALSAAGEITSISQFLENLSKEIVQQSGIELIKEAWCNENLQQCLIEHMGQHLAPDVVAGVLEHAVHMVPVVGQIIGSVIGWSVTGEKMDKALDHLRNAGLEFHQKVLIIVAVARVLCVLPTPPLAKVQLLTGMNYSPPPPPPQPVVSRRGKSWFDQLSGAASSVVTGLNNHKYAAGATLALVAVSGSSAGTSIIMEDKCGKQFISKCINNSAKVVS
jgi:hypothetical protein